jgi:hypothetical protein
MFLYTLVDHLIYIRQNADGTNSLYYYKDAYTWAVGGLALAWVTWMLVRRYLRLQKLRRPPRRDRRKNITQTAKIKRALRAQFLALGASGNVQALGVGMLASGEACIQIFVQNAAQETAPGAGPLPANYRGVPLVLIEMPVATFLSDTIATGTIESSPYPQGIRDRQEMLVGGISGANTNLSGESGTIGYFCTRRSLVRRRKEVHLLSNSHVFADLKKGKVDEHDLIMQPSPGEPGSNRPVGTLVNFSPLIFDGGAAPPNYIDAAIAKLWNAAPHQPLIPLIGAIKGLVMKADIEPGEAVRKFGRTTGYTEGSVISVHLDIWIRYDRTGKSAFFHDQILLEPAAKFAPFVSKGDSGSLVVDSGQRAVGLIFAGSSELPATKTASGEGLKTPSDAPATAQRLEGYGIANPISEVLDRLKIDLVI